MMSHLLNLDYICLINTFILKFSNKMYLFIIIIIIIKLIEGLRGSNSHLQKLWTEI